MSFWALVTHSWVLLLSQVEVKVFGELAGRIWFPEMGRTVDMSCSLQQVGRYLFFISLHVGESELCSSPLLVGADGQLSLGAAGQQGVCLCRAAHGPSAENDRLAPQC